MGDGLTFEALTGVLAIDASQRDRRSDGGEAD